MYIPEQRFRSRGVITPLVGITKTKNCLSGVWSETNVNQPAWCGNGYTEETTDFSGTDFRKHVSDGNIVINSYRNVKLWSTGGITGTGTIKPSTGSGCGITCTSGSISEWVYVGGPYTFKTLWDNSTSEWPDLLTDARVQAGTKASADIKSPETLGLVTAIELGKTFRMLVNPFSSLREILTKRAGWGSARKLETVWRLAQAGSKTHLEIVYGWLQTMRDIQDSIKALERQYTGERKRYTARGSVSYAHSPLDKSVYGTIPSQGGFKQDTIYKYNRFVEVRAGILYEAVITLQDNTGFAIGDIPSSGWEVIPFSFVVDWFLNVQDYVRAITPRIGVHILGSWTVVTQTTDLEWAKVITPQNPGNCLAPTYRKYTYSGTPGYSGTTRQVLTTRDEGVSVGITAFGTKKMLDSTSNISLRRIADATALIVSRIRPKHYL